MPPLMLGSWPPSALPMWALRSPATIRDPTAVSYKIKCSTTLRREECERAQTNSAHEKWQLVSVFYKVSFISLSSSKWSAHLFSACICHLCPWSFWELNNWETVALTPICKGQNLCTPSPVNRLIATLYLTLDWLSLRTWSKVGLAHTGCEVVNWRVTRAMR